MSRARDFCLLAVCGAAGHGSYPNDLDHTAFVAHHQELSHESLAKLVQMERPTYGLLRDRLVRSSTF
jgi:hypothetical protein